MAEVSEVREKINELKREFEKLERGNFHYGIVEENIERYENLYEKIEKSNFIEKDRKEIVHFLYERIRLTIEHVKRLLNVDKGSDEWKSLRDPLQSHHLRYHAKAAEEFVDTKIENEEIFEEKEKAVEEKEKASVALNVGEFGSAFEKHTKELKHSEVISSVLLFGVIILLLIYLSIGHSLNLPLELRSLTPKEKVPIYIIFRFSVLTVGLFLVAFFARQYNANRHARLLSSHKVNIFKTYKELGKSEHEVPAHVRDQITLTTLIAVIQEPSSAYLKQQPESQNIIKMLEDVSQKRPRD